MGNLQLAAKEMVSTCANSCPPDDSQKSTMRSAPAGSSSSTSKSGFLADATDLFELGAAGCGLQASERYPRDSSAALANDLGSQVINFTALRYVQSRPLSDEMVKALDMLMQEELRPRPDGRIPEAELKAFFERHHNHLQDWEMENLMEIADTDKSGSLDRQQFIVLCSKLLALRDERWA
eukprot:CAMPEP_0115050978 /NCGR_PEP_ID=MMETSP0227-20121206/2088_1 /TAXON_ID=89957 /ORGANISM="Polarella glacialis, Strain CCMP 1383" /LENGTH=179 /DNA_ID=CAMNT_0002434901 /DNA_START=59 /DNA_END=598 /DNA_ORIENTATION=+